MKIIIIIVILLIVFVIAKQIKLEKGAKRGLEKIIDLGVNLTEAENSNLTLKENEIYTQWKSKIKNEYDKIEASENDWNQDKYDNLFKETYPKIDFMIMNEYNIAQNELEKLIDIGDVISAKQISKREMEISNRVDQVKKGDLKSKIQVAKEFNTTIYEISEAMKKSTINLTLEFFKDNN